MYINWDAVTYFDPTSIDPLATHGIPLPTYGNYGGPNYSAGDIGGETPPTLPPVGDPDAPVDALDTLFYQHDLVYQQNYQGDPATPILVEADINLITGMLLLPNTAQDSESVFYEAFATLGFVGKLATINGGLQQLDDALPPNVPLIGLVGAAVQNFEAGLAELPGAETRSLHGAFAVFEHQFLGALFV